MTTSKTPSKKTPSKKALSKKTPVKVIDKQSAPDVKLSKKPSKKSVPAMKVESHSLSMLNLGLTGVNLVTFIALSYIVLF